MHIDIVAIKAELGRVREAIASAIDEANRHRDALKAKESEIAKLRTYEASVLYQLSAAEQHAGIALHEATSADHSQHAEVRLFLALQANQPIRTALRGYLRDLYPDCIERRDVLSLVQHARPEVKPTTVYSTLSQLVGEGSAEKSAGGYQHKTPSN